MKKLTLITAMILMLSSCGKKKYDCICYKNTDQSFVSIDETNLFGCAEFPTDSTYCELELARI
jgi:PBP1b-binding outer membrane lipoprotein LpoB